MVSWLYKDPTLMSLGSCVSITINKSLFLKIPTFIMLSRIVTTLTFNALLGFSRATLLNSTDCADIHFMLARGTTEDYPGTTYTMAELVAENTTLSTNYENIIYPAVSETESDSYFIGRAAVGSQVNRYAADCPNSRIVLISYSQGAMIVGDALAGGGGDSTLGNATQPLVSEDVSKHSMFCQPAFPVNSILRESLCKV